MHLEQDMCSSTTELSLQACSEILKEGGGGEGRSAGPPKTNSHARPASPHTHSPADQVGDQLQSAGDHDLVPVLKQHSPQLLETQLVLHRVPDPALQGQVVVHPAVAGL